MDFVPSPRGVPVALAELRSTEWLHLTFGMFWRSVVWAVISSLIGTLVSFAVAYGLGKVMSNAPNPVAYQRMAVPLTLVGSTGVGFLMFRWYTRWILSGRYGSLRLVVFRDIAS